MTGSIYSRAAAGALALVLMAGQGAPAAANDWGFTSGFHSHDRYAHYLGGEFAAEDFSGCGCWGQDFGYGRLDRSIYYGRDDGDYRDDDRGPSRSYRRDNGRGYGRDYGHGQGYGYGDGHGQAGPADCRHFDPRRGYYVTNWTC